MNFGRFELNGENRLFLLIFISLFIWFYFILDLLLPYILNNFLISYIAFIFVYIFLVMKYILDIDPMNDTKHYMAFVLVFLALDIIMFPILITKEAIADYPAQAQLSSDIFIYKLIASIPIVNTVFQTHIMKYVFVYIIAPTIMLIMARWLTTKRKFFDIIKQNV